MRELVLDLRISKQDREDQAARLVVIESNLNNTSVSPVCGNSQISVGISQISNPLYTHYNQEQPQHTEKSTFKMEIPRFDGTDPLG